MVCVFLAFSSSRNEVALETASSSSATSLESSATSSVSLAMEEVSSSISARNVSTESVFSLRVCSFVASSLSHQPLCSASSLASSMRRTMRSLSIFLTFSKGSFDTRTAKAESTRLFNSSLRLCKNSATRTCAVCWVVARKLTKAVAPSCASDGRCFSALPATAPLEMISMALLMASNSSVRSCWRDSKSLAFCSQVAVRSSR
mmetsp:Transcript_20131/g.52613  ORF Transcript_20131/g.52613 Transcript_20131/m.52613 type:complete len:203 (-) Transcript_20131:181-789(-)